MSANPVIAALGYENSPNFLRCGEFRWERVGAFAHSLRKAGAELSLKGAYTLDAPGGAIPLVYVCEAKNEKDVPDIHRQVWNQDIVPCLVLSSPHGVRVYSGFDYASGKSPDEQGLLEPLVHERDVANKLNHFSAAAIDSGRTWNHLASKVSPETRLNVRLLGNLEKLDRQLQDKHDLPRATSHALIGKFVYLHYLRDRGILSPKKLERWGIHPNDIFGPKATLDGLQQVSTKLDDWLNGGVFPIDFSRKSGLRSQHVRWVSGIFAGADVGGDGHHQLHLDFPAYDFSFIPVETLSVVYEQFLHDTPMAGGHGKARKTGAYYTPIPVVNLMLSQLDSELPLRRGMKVFDPTCGSGAFLVQCFRRLIEREFPGETKPKPGQLRELLQQSIFGVDLDPDACSVAELSLVLTLLDYVDPPDLEPPLHQFKLPNLRGENIVHGDFFTAPPPSRAPTHQYDWVIGNPPWRKINLKCPDPEFANAAAWITEHEKSHPVGNNEVARAVAWKAGDHLSPDGRAALLLPAMSLFETAAKTFRTKFFDAFDVATVANFSNLAEVLAPGRFRVPAAAVFFKHPGDDDPQSVRVFSPMVANQEITRPREKGKRIESWVITIDTSDVREIPVASIAAGDSLPWKIAAWGCPADAALLVRLRRKFPSLGDLQIRNVLAASQGLENRAWTQAEKLEEVPEIVGKKTFDATKLAKWRHIFSLPDFCVSRVPESERWVRKRGGVELPLSICRPPHVILSAARNFAIFSNEFIVVPPRQIGITSHAGDIRLLKALALFLSSDFARYHEFLSASQLGVQRFVSTLSSVRELPIPLEHLSSAELNEWVKLHDRLAKSKPRKLGDDDESEPAELDFSGTGHANTPADGIRELNERVARALGLTQREQELIRSLVDCRIHLNDGNIGLPAIRQPDDFDLESYCRALKEDLDGFLGVSPAKGNDLAVVRIGDAALLRVTHPGLAKPGIRIGKPPGPKDGRIAETFATIGARHPQWPYFRRSLRYYEGDDTYLLKPLQRFQWTVAQATMDAASFIADHLSARPAK